MTEALHGHILQARVLGEYDIMEHGYLVVDGGVIMGVFPALPERYAGIPVRELGERIISPSFADMHLHAPQFAMLGTGMDLPLLDWLSAYAFPTEAQFADTDYAREVYRALADRLIRLGTTRVCMFSSLHADATLVLMEALERAGVTGYVGKVNMDRGGSGGLQETTEASMRETERWLDACGSFSHVKPILTPRFTPSCSAELMAYLGRLARERGLYVQSHLSENEEEIALVRSLHPDCAEYWETYDQYGLFSDHTVMAHCVHSSEREQLAMKERGVLVAHCPDSNINICSGFAPVREMLNRGLWVALGSDIAGGAELSMMRVITGCIRTSNAKYIASDRAHAPLSVAEAVYLGTTSGARYFGAGDGFAAGKRLHALVLDDSALPPTRARGVRDRFERMLYLAEESCIQAVYSEGRRIV